MRLGTNTVHTSTLSYPVFVVTVAQTEGPPCPTLLDVPNDPSTTCTVNNCTSVTCTIPSPSAAGTPIGTVTIVVDPCSDPVSVLASVSSSTQSSDETRRVFLRSDTVYFTVVDQLLFLDMSRNATFLNLEVCYYDI